MTDTPMLAQYRTVKSEFPDAIVLFRLGDFYEMFFDDAEVAARELSIVLTSRPSGGAGRIPMAGVPYHAADQYIGRLLAAGHKVAICDQVPDGTRTRGLMDREVTRVITPGTITDSDLLDDTVNNYLTSVCTAGDAWGFAAADLSTGEFWAGECPTVQQAMAEISRFRPAELVLPAACQCIGVDVLGGRVPLSRFDDLEFDPARAEIRLCELLGVRSLAGFGLDDCKAAVSAAGGLISYARAMHRNDLGHLTLIRRWWTDKSMNLDEATRRNLELVRRLSDGSREGSLLSVVDYTMTPQGGRLVRRWLERPLTSLKECGLRHARVEQLVRARGNRLRLRMGLARVRDIERLAARAALGSATALELVALRTSLLAAPELQPNLEGLDAFAQLACELTRPDLAELADLLVKAIVDELPASTGEGGMIRRGWDSELDRLRDLSAGQKQWIADMERAERERTGIKSLRVGFNKVFGYYLEVTRPNLPQVPDSYIRRQTLANAERFVTPELKEREAEILSADERSHAMEQEILVGLRKSVAEVAAELQSLAASLAEIDVLAGFAELAVERNYVRPELTDDPVLDIRSGRHPVLEVMMPPGEFVPNDCLLDDSWRFAVITGPNMAGKSTYLRQAALICLLAQAGSFVPARSARLGMADRIFTRVGAGDDLSRGQSTFMVEMTEVANIVNNATERSLVVLDEVGRGTSTFDGLSIAWAMSEHLVRSSCPRVLFATHYHELTRLADEFPKVVNLSVAVRERGDSVVFLRRVVRGATDRSYGIEVARLAGVPTPILERAREVLSQLEQDGSRVVRVDNGRAYEQTTLFVPASHPLLEELRTLNLVELTPLDALTLLAGWQRRLGGDG